MKFHSIFLRYGWVSQMHKYRIWYFLLEVSKTVFCILLTWTVVSTNDDGDISLVMAPVPPTNWILHRKQECNEDARNTGPPSRIRTWYLGMIYGRKEIRFLSGKAWGNWKRNRRCICYLRMHAGAFDDRLWATVISFYQKLWNKNYIDL